MMTVFRRRTTIILLLALAFLLRAWGLDFGLPYKLHPDEHQYIGAALDWYIKGDLRLHVVNPPLLIYILSLAYKPWLMLAPVTETQTWVSQAVVFGRLWSVFFGVLTVALSYAAGKRVGTTRTGLMAMVLMATAFLPAREAHFGVNDSLVTFLVLLAVYVSLRLFSDQRWRMYAAAGVVVGLTATAKLTGGLVALVLVTTHGMVNPVLNFRPHRKLLLAGLAALSVFFLVTTPLWFSPDIVIEDVIKHLEFGTEGYKGALMAPATGWQFYLDVLGWGIGWPLLLVSVVSLIAGFRRRPRLVITLVTFPIVLFLYMGGQKILFARFILPMVPLLLILAALGLSRWFAAWSFWPRRPVWGWLIIGLLTAQPLANLIWFDHLLTMPDTRTLATEWILQELPENTIITQESYSVFPKYFMFSPDIPYKLMAINERSSTSSNLDHYLSRTTQYVTVSNYTYERARVDPADEALRLEQLAYLDEHATLVKTFDPYRPGYQSDWFYQDEIYGPAAETLQRISPGPLIKIYRVRPPTLDQLEISVPYQANFADQIHLLGYDMFQTRVQAGEALPVTLYWQAPAQKSPEADFIQFNRLLAPDGMPHGGYDREPNEYYNTHLWQPGQIVVDVYTVPVEADAPPGQYYLNVGYYLTVGESAVNLPLVVDGQMTDVTSVTIGPIEVVAPGE